MIESCSTMLLTNVTFAPAEEIQSLAAVCRVNRAVSDANPWGLYEVSEQPSSQTGAQF